MGIAETVATYLVRVATTTIVQLLTLFGPGLALVAAVSTLSGYVMRLAIRAFGVHLYLLLFGGLGTAIHEIGHALFLLLFGYTVPKLELFKIDVKTGSLGKTYYVPDESNLFKVIGLFFIGMAPILFGTLMIFSALLILFQHDMVELMQRITLLKSDQYAQSVAGGLLYQTLAYCTAILAFIFNPAHFADWRFYLFLYLTFVIGSSIHLSDSDIKAATAGFIALVILVVVFNLATLWQTDVAIGSFSLLSQSYAFFYAILLLTLALNLLAALLLFLPALVLGRR